MAVERGWHAVSQFRLHGSSELLCMHCDLSNMRSSKRYYGHHVTSATVWAHEPQMRLKHRVLGYFTTNDQVLVQDVGLVLMSREEKNVQQKVQFNRGAVGSDRIDILLFIPPEMDVAVTIGEYWIDDLSRMVYICKSLVFNLCLVGVLYLVFRQLKWSYSIDETRGEDVERWYWPLSKLKGLLTCGTGGGNDAKDGEELRFKPHAKFFGSLRICDFNTVFLVFVGIVMPIFGVLQFRGAGGPTFNQFIWYAGLIAFWAFVAFLAAPGCGLCCRCSLRCCSNCCFSSLCLNYICSCSSNREQLCEMPSSCSFDAFKNSLCAKKQKKAPATSSLCLSICRVIASAFATPGLRLVMFSAFSLSAVVLENLGLHQPTIIVGYCVLYFIVIVLENFKNKM
eukprot:747225_1